MAKVLGFLIRHFSNNYILHRSDLAARAAPLDPRLNPLRKDILFVTLYYYFYQKAYTTERRNNTLLSEFYMFMF